MLLNYKDVCQVVLSSFIKEHFPYLEPINPDNIESGTPIKTFMKPLNIINPDRYPITFEHAGEVVNSDHSQYNNPNEHCIYNIVKYNNTNEYTWCIPLRNVFCLRRNNSNNKVDFLHIYSQCSTFNPLEMKIMKPVIISTDCILFPCGWPDGFQHGTQDILPRICACIDWLNQNPDVSLLLPFNTTLMWWFDKYLNSKIKNHIIFSQHNWIIPANESVNIYTDYFSPKHRCEMLFYSLYRNINFIQMNTKDEYIIIFDRSKCSSRSVNNEKLIDLINSVSTKYPIKVVNPDEYTQSQMVSLMKNCVGVVAPHGGANYNVLFMRRTKHTMDKTRFFIELVANTSLHHTYHIALGSYIKYKAVVCQGDHYTKELIFDDEYIKSALSLFLN